jgi:hypothetical protein
MPDIILTLSLRPQGPGWLNLGIYLMAYARAVIPREPQAIAPRSRVQHHIVSTIVILSIADLSADALSTDGQTDNQTRVPLR